MNSQVKRYLHGHGSYTTKLEYKRASSGGLEFVSQTQKKFIHSFCAYFLLLALSIMMMCIAFLFSCLHFFLKKLSEQKKKKKKVLRNLIFSCTCLFTHLRSTHFTIIISRFVDHCALCKCIYALIQCFRSCIHPFYSVARKEAIFTCQTRTVAVLLYRNTILIIQMKYFLK